jgi:hypothetical protein
LSYLTLRFVPETVPVPVDNAARAKDTVLVTAPAPAAKADPPAPASSRTLLATANPVAAPALNNRWYHSQLDLNLSKFKTCNNCTNKNFFFISK